LAFAPSSLILANNFLPVNRALGIQEVSMEISNIPKDLYDLLVRNNLTQPKLCYTNSFQAVMNTISKQQFDIHYVLGTVTTKEGHEFDHAFIKCNGKYHDPTLEPQGLHSNSTYKIEKEFSPLEIVDLLKNKFPMADITEMVEGKKPWWPLQKTSVGVYQFVDV